MDEELRERWLNQHFLRKLWRRKHLYQRFLNATVMTEDSGIQNMRNLKIKSAKNSTIEFLRFIFAVIVVLHHSRYILGDDKCYFLGGSLAVEFFLFVSGYLLMASVERTQQREKNVAAEDLGNRNALTSDGRRGELTQAKSEWSTSPSTCSRPGLGSETLHFILRKIKSFLPEFLIAWGIGFVFVALVRRWSLGQMWDAFRDDFWELTLVKMSGLFTHGIDGVMWYLSAMLLAMAVLYPLLRKFRDVMSHLVCPLTALFLYGYLCREQGHPRDPVVWTGLFYKGLLRTMAGLCVGIVIYLAVKCWKRCTPQGLTAAGNVLDGAAELVLLVITIRYMYLGKPSEEDYFFMFLLMLLVLLAFAGGGVEAWLQGGRTCRGQEQETAESISESGTKSESDGDFESEFARSVGHPRMRQLAGWLGRYSLPLYLGHLYFAQHMNEIPALAALSGQKRMLVYLILAVGNALLIMWLAGIWRRCEKAVKAGFRRFLIR